MPLVYTENIATKTNLIRNNSKVVSLDGTVPLLTDRRRETCNFWWLIWSISAVHQDKAGRLYCLIYFVLFCFGIPFPGRPDIWLTGRKSIRKPVWNNVGICFLNNSFLLMRWRDSPPRDKPEQKWYAQWAVQIVKCTKLIVWLEVLLDASFIHTGRSFAFLFIYLFYLSPQWLWSWRLCLLQTMTFTGTFILVNNAVVSLL